MKTKFYYYISILFLCLCHVSCEDFLEETNKSGLTTDPFMKTKVGIESALNSCYSGARTFYGQEDGFGMTESGTDLFLRGGDNKANQLADYTIDLNGSQSTIGNVWKNLYLSLSACNQTISLLPSEVLTEAENKSFEGQAKFWRAFYLWLITETWGDVVLNTEPITGAVPEAHRSSVEDFYKVIFDDLDVAVNQLAPGKSTDGRITQDVAKAFKARACLTRACATGEASLYAEAAMLAKDIINSQRYSFYTDYSDMWDIANCDGGTNKEAIFSINYTNSELENNAFDATATNSGNKGIVDFVMKYDKESGMERDVLNARPFQRYMPSRYLLQLYNENIDQRYKVTFKDAWYANKNPLSESDLKVYPLMATGDTAIYIMKTAATDSQKVWASKRYRLLDVNDVYTSEGKAILRSQFVEMHKFADPTAVYNQDWCQRDAFVIRLPEMYFIAAEAMLQTNKQEAVDLMNEFLMKRAIPSKENDMRITESELTIDFILDERARELCGEQIRWFDLKRTKKLVEYVKLHNMDAKDNIQEYHMLRPIPQNQLDAVTNKDEFTQNPGYTK